MTRQIVQRHQLKSLASMSSDDAFTVSILIAIDNKMPVFRNRLLSDVWPTNQRSLFRYSVRTENPQNHPPLKADSVTLGGSINAIFKLAQLRRCQFMRFWDGCCAVLSADLDGMRGRGYGGWGSWRPNNDVGLRRKNIAIFSFKCNCISGYATVRNATLLCSRCW